MRRRAFLFSRKTLLILLALLPGGLRLSAGGWQEGGGLELPDVLGIEIDAGEMNVNIVPSKNGVTAFKSEGLLPGDRMQHEAGDLVIRFRLLRVQSAPFGTDPGTATLSLAPGMLVRVFTTTGNVAAGNLTADKITVSSRSGSVDVKNLVSSLNLRSSTGSISVDRSNGAKVLTSVSGNITVTDSDGSLDTSSPSGNHLYRRIRGNLAVRGGTGSLTVDLVRGWLRLYSSTGEMSCSNVFLTDNSDFRSNSGNITVELLNKVPEVGFDLATTTGRITAGSRTSGTAITVRNPTGVFITGRSSTGDQRYFFSPAENTGGDFDPSEAGSGM